MKKIFFKVVGFFCILIGILGVILPILPGWALIFVCLSMIAPIYTLEIRRKIALRYLKPEIIRLEEWKNFGIDAGFTTRRFPLFLKETNDFLDVAHQSNFIKMFGGASRRFAFLNQVHGSRVEILEDVVAYQKEGFYQFLEADSVITNLRGLTLLVMTADCLSVFFYAKGWIGIAHAGWRGTKDDVAVKTLKAICEKSGSNAADVQIAFGPCIGKDHYQVGEEFNHFFRNVTKKNGKHYFDLFLENRVRLLEAGALDMNMAGGDFCTVTHRQSLYSFRKEKSSAGRMISFATILD